MAAVLINLKILNFIFISLQLYIVAYDTSTDAFGIISCLGYVR